MNFLVVGAGIYGCTIARLLKNGGHNVGLIDKRDVVGGNCYDEFMGENYYRHVYGPHIFHTSNDKVWEFVNKYAKFNNYVHKVIAEDDEKKHYSLPFNRTTFGQILGTDDPCEVQDIITNEIKESNIEKITNLEEQAISMVGKTIYEKLIKNYTERQWGKKCTELSPEIIKRIPLRFSYNDNYFNDNYQGIPIDGYSDMMLNILEGIDDEEIVLFKLNRKFNIEDVQKYDRIIYCGPVDELLNYELGELEWRTMRFDNIAYQFDYANSMGVAQMNKVGKLGNVSRIIDHVYFYPENLDKCINKWVIKTFEIPEKWDKTKERFYPINTKNNQVLYEKYVKLLKEKYPNIVLGGRLGKYKYLDMDDAILEAMNDYSLINCQI